MSESKDLLPEPDPIEPFVVLETERIYDSPWVGLRRDWLKLEDGARQEHHVIGGAENPFEAATHQRFFTVVAELEEHTGDVGGVFELGFTDLNRHERGRWYAKWPVGVSRRSRATSTACEAGRKRSTGSLRSRCARSSNRARRCEPTIHR